VRDLPTILSRVARNFEAGYGGNRNPARAQAHWDWLVGRGVDGRYCSAWDLQKPYSREEQMQAVLLPATSPTLLGHTLDVGSDRRFTRDTHREEYASRTRAGIQCDLTKAHKHTYDASLGPQKAIVLDAGPGRLTVVLFRKKRRHSSKGRRRVPAAILFCGAAAYLPRDGRSHWQRFAAVLLY